MLLGGLSVFLLLSVHAEKITLDKDAVQSAADIEAAIADATDGGGESGIVVLDGKKGAFVFSGADRAIDIQYPNVTLCGINGALIKNLDEGINIAANKITIKGLAWQGKGISAIGTPKNILIENNYILSSQTGIWAMGKNWKIQNNTLFSAWYGIKAGDLFDSTIEKNTVMSANRYETVGIEIQYESKGIKVIDNLVSARDCILVHTPSNQILRNKIVIGSGQAGIFVFNPGNKVIDNKIFSSRWGINPETIIQAAPGNTISGNRIWEDGV